MRLEAGRHLFSSVLGEGHDGEVGHIFFSGSSNNDQEHVIVLVVTIHKLIPEPKTALRMV